jgi:hypothetical protein
MRWRDAQVEVRAICGNQLKTIDKERLSVMSAGGWLAFLDIVRTERLSDVVRL